MTDDTRSRRILDAFDAVLDLSTEARDGWLKAHFAGDDDLIMAVMALIAADEVAPGAMPTEVPDGAGETILVVPKRIGPYALVEKIGAGGMGEVWLGQRDDGLFEQDVAIKLMRPSRFSPDALAFFGTERQALARLRHDHIARLYDGGVTPEGLPWFVMERIEGLALNAYAEVARPGRDALVKLMITLCQAVHHAHGRMVVHADIKPSNVLVTSSGEPFLVDFGIASMAQSLAERSHNQASPSTPAYASPERRCGGAPTTADDIYGLGLLLNGVLTGTWPTAPLDAPPQPGALDPRADRDLDAVVARACATDPDARYASAQAMADDLRAFLDKRPVAARGSDPRYLVSRFAARHPRSVAASLAAVVVLVAGLALTSALFVRANHERALAQQRFDDVRALSGFLLGEAYDGMDHLAGAAKLKARTTDVARTYLDGLAKSPDASRDLEREIAIGLGRVGHATAINSTNASGDMAVGERALVESETRLRRLVIAAPADDDLKAELARTLTWRSSVLLGMRNDPKAAQSVLEEALALYDGVMSRRPGKFEDAYGRANTVLGMVDVLVSRDDLKGVIDLIRREEPKVRALPESGGWMSQKALIIAAMENALGDATYYVETPAAGMRHYQAAIAALEAARARGGRDVRVPLRLALYYNQMASSYQDLKRPGEGMAWADKADALAEEVRRYDDSVLAARVLNVVSLERATLLSDMGDHRGALAEAERNVARRQADLDSDPDNQEQRINLASALRSYAEYFVAAGDRKGACLTARRSRTLFDDVATHGGVPQRHQKMDIIPLESLLKSCA